MPKIESAHVWAVVISILAAVLRLSGVVSPAYQAFAHVLTGMLLAAWLLTRSWSFAFEARLYMVLFWTLVAVELFALREKILALIQRI